MMEKGGEGKERNRTKSGDRKAAAYNNWIITRRIESQERWEMVEGRGLGQKTE
jgi:hypothetical protein